MVSRETICLFPKYNAIVIIKLMKNQVKNKLFFILYDNLNFYDKVKE